jgi:hypothetical protein
VGIKMVIVMVMVMALLRRRVSRRAGRTVGRTERRRGRVRVGNENRDPREVIHRFIALDVRYCLGITDGCIVWPWPGFWACWEMAFRGFVH